MFHVLALAPVEDSARVRLRVVGPFPKKAKASAWAAANLGEPAEDQPRWVVYSPDEQIVDGVLTVPVEAPS